MTLRKAKWRERAEEYEVQRNEALAEVEKWKGMVEAAVEVPAEEASDE